ncbi:DNA-binding response regulator, NarL/FixJ family, contains REC and HTH domains [Bradyrhizobium shewense]|uniref:DNA-binding response regulator, NarL/FixJ family, contains REC and HTH domains n=1 Tax=Bradyrhizobium shewense TaxID=1761772 RepID=A0A1C3XCK7_9BRAD|nr:DNA-binding response regulator, NarL/FixJ family, contains REC and HTH domains [Bradyrhizobium shewense]
MIVRLCCRFAAGIGPEAQGSANGNDAVKRILIADDHEVVRSGLRAIIEAHSSWIVSGVATDGEQAVALALETRPDIVIVDYSMPVMNGLEVSRRLKALHLGAQVLILTMHESEELLTEAILAGVRGFLFKSDARKHLISAIEALLDGRPYFTSILLERLLHDYQGNKENRADMLLTSREQSVVQLIAEGHTNRSISSILKLSVKTVETHRASAMRKLRMSSTAELVRYAIRKKLVLP